MSVIGDLRAGLKANLDPIDGINVFPYFHPNPFPPLIHMWPSGEVDFHGAFAKGLVTYTFTVQALVDWTDDPGSQHLLDKFMGANDDYSVASAIESDVTLGGVADSVKVVNMTGHEPTLTGDNASRLTVTWTVEIFVNGSSA